MPHRLPRHTERLNFLSQTVPQTNPELKEVPENAGNTFVLQLLTIVDTTATIEL